MSKEHFDRWDIAVNSYGYYGLFAGNVHVYFQADKVTRLCQSDIESIEKAKPVLSLSTAGLTRVIKSVTSFIKMDNSDPN